MAGGVSRADPVKLGQPLEPVPLLLFWLDGLVLLSEGGVGEDGVFDALDPLPLLDPLLPMLVPL